ncbi:Mitochondrial presequence protease, partial [Zancudomyces culisetae]
KLVPKNVKVSKTALTRNFSAIPAHIKIAKSSAQSNKTSICHQYNGARRSYSIELSQGGLAKKAGAKAGYIRKEYTVGQVIEGFEVKKVKKIKEYDIDAVILEDTRTGAQWLHLGKDDSNNVFSVGFNTSPSNSKGIPHILEHVALCGSKNYPVRDPFFKMLNRSLSTFMNAWTAHNYTQYPFSTQNMQDYQNLQEVYLDAVFNPLLRKKDFEQEGWRLEKTEEGQEAKDGNKFEIKGVVYNEMKGVFSDADNVLQSKGDQSFFKGTTYQYESGGEPMEVPKLGYEELVEFYKTHYHPSNSKFYSYGSFELEPQLKRVSKILGNYSRLEPHKQQDLDNIKHSVEREGGEFFVEIEGPVESAESVEKQNKYSVSYLMNEVNNTYETFVAGLFSTLLLNGTSAPMHKALIDSGLCADYSANSGYNNQTRETSLTIGCQGVSRQDLEHIDQAITQTIEQVHRDGFEPMRIDAAIHSLELMVKHDSAHFGMNVMKSINASWFLGNKNPIELVEYEENLNKIKEKLAVNQDIFKELIEKYLLNSQHKMKLLMKANPDYSAKLEIQEQKLTAQVIEEYLASQKSKQTKQTEQEDEEKDEECLPSLKLSQVDKQTTRYVLDHCSINKVPVQTRITPKTNGISYVTALHSLNQGSVLDSELIPYLTLFCDSLTYLGTRDKSMAELETEINLRTGGFSISPYVASDYADPNNDVQFGISIGSNCLDADVAHMYRLYGELVAETDFEKHATRLQTLITASAAGAFNKVVGSGHGYAMNLAAKDLDHEAHFNYLTSGLGQVQFIGRLSSANIDDVVSKLKQIQKAVLASSIKVAINVSTETAADQNTQQLSKLLTSAFAARSAAFGNESTNVSWFVPSPNSNTAFKLPFATNFAARAIKTGPTYSHHDSAVLQVLSKLLGPNHLHPQIRELNGAYGSGCLFSPITGLLSFFSYRDPNPQFSLSTFDRSHTFVSSSKDAIAAKLLDQAKLSVFKDIDSPIASYQQGKTYFRTGITDDMRQTRRQAILDVTTADILAAAETYINPANLPLSCDAAICDNASFESIVSNSDGKSKWNSIDLSLSLQP